MTSPYKACFTKFLLCKERSSSSQVVMLSLAVSATLAASATSPSSSVRCVREGCERTNKT